MPYTVMPAAFLPPAKLTIKATQYFIWSASYQNKLLFKLDWSLASKFTGVPELLRFGCAAFQGA